MEYVSIDIQIAEIMFATESVIQAAILFCKPHGPIVFNIFISMPQRKLYT